MAYSDLIPILDRFLEAAANAGKWRALTPAFRTHAPAVGKVFAAQGAALMKRAGGKAKEGGMLLPGVGLYAPLREALSVKGWETAWDQVAVQTQDELATVVQGLAVAGLEAGTAAIGKQFAVGTAFNLKNPRAVAYLKEHGAAMVSGINDATKARIREIVTMGADQGLSYTEVAFNIESEFAGFAKTSAVDILLDKSRWSRAEIVSIQELSMAYENGNSMVVSDLVAGGLTMQKAWLTVHDDRVDPGICAANESQGWIAYEDAFQSAHMAAPGHVLCRCTTLYRRQPRG